MRRYAGSRRKPLRCGLTSPRSSLVSSAAGSSGATLREAIPGSRCQWGPGLTTTTQKPTPRLASIIPSDEGTMLNATSWLPFFTFSVSLRYNFRLSSISHHHRCADCWWHTNYSSHHNGTLESTTHPAPTNTTPQALGLHNHPTQLHHYHQLHSRTNVLQQRCDTP